MLWLDFELEASYKLCFTGCNFHLTKNVSLIANHTNNAKESFRFKSLDSVRVICNCTIIITKSYMVPNIWRNKKQRSSSTTKSLHSMCPSKSLMSTKVMNFPTLLCVCLHVTMTRPTSACNDSSSPGFFLMIDYSLLGEWGLSPCCRVQYHVFAQQGNIPAGPMISSGHSFSSLPTVMALCWGSATPPGPPRFSLWPPWQRCPSAACQPHQGSRGWLESGRNGGNGAKDEANTVKWSLATAVYIHAIFTVNISNQILVATER